jgi:hypothetical protein
VCALTPGPSPSGEGRTALGVGLRHKPLYLWERGWGEGELGKAVDEVKGLEIFQRGDSR